MSIAAVTIRYATLRCPQTAQPHVVQVMVLLVVQNFINDELTGDHDWVNPSDELLASLREELDLDLRDAPDDSDDGGSRAGVEGGPIRKCRPWHWLQEMRCAA